VPCWNPRRCLGISKSDLQARPTYHRKRDLRIYAKCIDVQDAIAKRRIAEALCEHAYPRPAELATN
jgi:hypothetical protein